MARTDNRVYILAFVAHCRDFGVCKCLLRRSSYETIDEVVELLSSLKTIKPVNADAVAFKNWDDSFFTKFAGIKSSFNFKMSQEQPWVVSHSRDGMHATLL